MLEPIALPSASPLSPFLVATIEVTSSGRDVPIATIVRPMKFWLTPKLAAMIQALSFRQRYYFTILRFLSVFKS